MNKGVLLGVPPKKISAYTELSAAIYNVQTTDRCLLFTGGGAINRTVNLPSAESFGVGTLFIGDGASLINVSHPVTINAWATDVIYDPSSSGADATLQIAAVNAVAQLFCDGKSRWVVVGMSGSSIGGDVGGSGGLLQPGSVQVTGWRGQFLGAGFAAPSEGDVPFYTAGAWSEGALPASQLPLASSTYTPTLTQSGTVTKTVSMAKYIQYGKLVFLWVKLVPTAAGSAGTAVIVGMPVTAAAGGTPYPIGTGIVTLAATQYRVAVVLNTTTTLTFRRTDAAGTLNLGADPSAALASSGDAVNVFCVYEAA